MFRRYRKRDHDLVDYSAVLLSFSTRTYTVVVLIHFLVLWRITRSFSLAFRLRTTGAARWSGLALPVCGIDPSLSLRRWCILKDGW